MNKTKRISNRVFTLATSVVICAIAFCPRLAFAQSISLSGGTWALGTKAASSETTSTANNWTVTNDSGGTEDVNIKVASTLAWTASADATLTTNEFLLRKDSSSGQIITATDGSLVTSLANGGTHSFGLYFKTPPTGSEEGAHTLTITLTAAAPSCSGYNNTYCWHRAPNNSTDCTTTCASYGGVITNPTLPLSLQQAVCTNLSIYTIQNDECAYSWQTAGSPLDVIISGWYKCNVCSSATTPTWQASYTSSEFVRICPCAY